VPRCVVLRAHGLGELLTAVPALRALRQGIPDHEIVLATPRTLVPVARLTGAVDDVVHHPGSGPLGWDGPPPELAVDLHGAGPPSKGALLALRPGRLVAFAGSAPDGRWVPGPPWREDEHEVHRWCRLVQGLGLVADPTDLRLDPPAGVVPAAGPGPVVIHPGASSAARRWPADRFAQVAAWASRFAPVALTGSRSDRRLCEEVRRRASLPEDSVLAGRTDALDLAGLVAAARLVICGDTGVAHLAAAYARPSVILCGPSPPGLCTPPVDGPQLVLYRGDPGDRRSRDRHSASPDPRLLRITVHDVIEAAISLLWQRPSPVRESYRSHALPPSDPA